jgi:lysophospholipase L1-like esterase
MILLIRALLFSLLALTVFGQNNGNFSLSTKENQFSIAAGTSAASALQMKAIAGYSQPVYLIPGALPEGISVTIPSPVVGSQEVKLQVRAAVHVKPQTYALTVYAAGAGENHSISFSLTVLPAGTAPSLKPEIASTPVKLKPAERPEDKPQIGSHWVASWGSSAVIPSNDNGAYYLTNVTIREIAHLSIGTQTGIRIRLSNALGKDSVSFGAVHVAQWAGDAKTVTSAILPATDQVVTFCGSTTIVIPGGEEVFSDPIPMPLPAGADLAVSIFVQRTSNVPATMHQFGNQTSYFSLGDATVSTTFSNALTDSVRPYLTGIDVDTPGAMAVVALGDSLTDGMLSTRDQNLRWPDDLARRLQDSGADRLAVVNEGIAGNCMLINCMGPNITDRFKRDVLSIPGVKYLILLAGANDIGHAPDLAAAQLTDAYRSMVSLAHQNNILVYGATIPPFGGSNYFSAKHEKIRQDVNDFIRNGKVFDGVIDFDRALADQKNPTYLRAQYNGDKIRPNDAGYQAMADSIDLGLFNSNPR